MKNKKGQGLSLNTIIIAAIALLVLVVLVMIFTGRMSVFTGGVSGCVNQGGKCMGNTECNTAPGTKITASGCTTAGEICCVIKP
jgi:uncharacterized membrane protein YqiK